MIKVLHKAFRILEIIAENPYDPISVKELAERMQINNPTTVRILKDLANMGYVEQLQRNKGYTLGPMGYQIGANGNYLNEIVKVGKPLIHKCAETVSQSVLLSVIRNKRRHILCHSNFNPALNIDTKKLYYDDIYLTATGRMGLAYLQDDELKQLIDEEGLPNDAWEWGHITDYISLKKTLSDIRGEGFYTGNNDSQMTVVAAPVLKNGLYVAALGASMPNFINLAEKEHVISKVRETAKLISLGLSKTNSFS